ncbi:MAG: amidohydrolase [Bradyrhizobiaceae bacterium]|nr:MAG: amidohydrolase [Bradyrhizobiaceae bacterium]
MCMNCGFANALGAFMTDQFRGDIDRRRFMQASLACVGVGASSLSLTGAAFSATAATDRASVIFRNGKVYTLDAKKPWAQAVAVAGDRIVAVGSDADVAALAGPETKTIDLAGRMLMPGFVEAHIHPFLGAFMTAGVDLQVATAKDALAAIAAFAKAHPTGTIRGFGWRVDMFPPEGPTREMLDAVIADRPAFFLAIDAHSLWANSKALEIAGIDTHTPDPVPGFSYYIRDKSGKPTGYVMETSALLQVVNAIEPISLDSMAQLLVDWLPKASAAGITSVYDAGVPPIGADQGAILEIYTELEKQGRLPFRVVGSYLLKAPPIEAATASTQDLMRRIDTGLVQVRVLKMLGDGTPGGYTAWLTEPYADKPDSIGSSPFSEAQWKSVILDADRAGIDVHVHACGERTAHVALDAIEAAIAANPPRDRRHTIAHNVLTDDVDIPRFGKLGVIAQFSANWLSADPDTVDSLTRLYGPERQSKIYRPKSILMAGGAVTFGSDWPAAGYLSTYKPLDAVQIAMTRQLIGKPDAPVLAPLAERMDLKEALHAATLAGARQIRLEHNVGSIEPGKRADLVVLAKNLFDVEPHDIASTPIDMTMMNGRFTHVD